MSQHSHTSIPFWREFFQMYRSMPELWLVRSKPYRNRRLKDQSYLRLLTHLRQLHPNANIYTLKRKINNFRTSYRRELRKVLSSDDSYESALWYFKDMNFLRELESGNMKGNMQYAKELEKELEEDPEPLALQNRDNTEEYLQQSSAESINLPGLGGHTGMEFNEMNEVSSPEQEHDHQVVIHHIETDSDDEDIFFHKSEDMDPVSDGEAEPEPFLYNEADPDLEPEPVSVRLKTELRGNNFHDSLMSTANNKPSSYGNQSMKSAKTMRSVRRLHSSNPSDYGESSEVKRRRVSEELSPDRDNNGRNRDRVIDRESDNECDLIGRRMAAHFRNMQPDQRLFAERIISEVLVFGRMNRLSLDSQFIPSRK